MKSIAFAFIFLFSSSALAREGFSSNVRSAPLAVQKIWDSTFAFVRFSPTFFIGTAFLLFKRTEGDNVELYFLTAAHNLKGCKVDSVCPFTSLVQNVDVFDRVPKVEVRTRDGLRFDTVELGSMPEDTNFAFLKVVVSRETSNLPEPVPLPKSCELEKGSALFGIGFPWTPIRTNPKRLPIANADLVTKRWSQGVFIDYMTLSKQKYIQVISSVDSLVGSSGGPVFTADGTVVSFFNQSATQSGHAYDGSDDVNEKNYHSVGPHCEFFKDLRESLYGN